MSDLATERKEVVNMGFIQENSKLEKGPTPQEVQRTVKEFVELVAMVAVVLKSDNVNGNMLKQASDSVKQKDMGQVVNTQKA